MANAYKVLTNKKLSFEFQKTGEKKQTSKRDNRDHKDHKRKKEQKKVAE